MKKVKPVKAPIHPALVQDLPERLSELTLELQRHKGRKVEDRVLQPASEVEDVLIGREKAVQFKVGKKVYATGHTDVTYADSNHSRGVRHLRFYEAGKVVLEIEGDFEDQQLGSNFKFKNVDIYLTGPWEKTSSSLPITASSTRRKENSGSVSSVPPSTRASPSRRPTWFLSVLSIEHHCFATDDLRMLFEPV